MTAKLAENLNGAYSNTSNYCEIICLRKQASRVTGLAPIYIEVVYYTTTDQRESKRKRYRYNTGIAVPPKYWSPSKKEILLSYRAEDGENGTSLNAKLKSKKSSFDRVLSEKEMQPYFNNDEIDLFKKLYPNRQDAVKRDLIWHLDQYIKTRKEKGNPYGTVKEFITVRNRLLKFQTSKRMNLTFADMGITFSDQLEIFLRKLKREDGEPLYAASTIEKTFEVLLVFLNHYWDVRNEAGNEFVNFIDDSFKSKKFGKIEDVIEAPPIPLTESEFLLLYKSNDAIDGNRNLSMTRKRFLLQAAVGCRVSDLFVLGEGKNKISDKEIIYYPNKTKTRKKGEKNRITLPMNKYALEILKEVSPRNDFGKIIKYSSAPLKKSSQKYNDDIKELFKALFEPLKKHRPVLEEHEVTGVAGDKKYNKDEVLSTHNARDTFISICLNQGISVPLVMEWVGQTKFDTMKKYFKVDNSKANEYMKKAFGF